MDARRFSPFKWGTRTAQSTHTVWASENTGGFQDYLLFGLLQATHPTRVTSVTARPYNYSQIWGLSSAYYEWQIMVLRAGQTITQMQTNVWPLAVSPPAPAVQGQTVFKPSRVILFGTCAPYYSPTTAIAHAEVDIQLQIGDEIWLETIQQDPDSSYYFCCDVTIEFDQ